MEPLQLIDGIEYNGIRHFVVEMHLPTMGDLLDVERTGDGKLPLEKSMMLLCKHVTSIGTIPKEAITPKLLHTLSEVDFERMSEYRDLLKKKSLLIAKVNRSTP